MYSTRDVAGEIGHTPRNTLKIASALGIHPKKIGRSSVWTAAMLARIERESLRRMAARKDRAR